MVDRNRLVLLDGARKKDPRLLLSGVQGKPRRHVRKRVSDRCFRRVAVGDTILRGVLALEIANRPGPTLSNHGERDGAEMSGTGQGLRVFISPAFPGD